MSQVYYLIAFNSINHANYFESELRKYGHKIVMIETPKYLSKDYYVALKITEDALSLAKEKTKEINLESFKIFKELVDGEKKTYEKLELKEEYDKKLLEILFPPEVRSPNNSKEEISKKTNDTNINSDKQENKEDAKAYNIVNKKTSENDKDVEKKNDSEEKLKSKCSEEKIVSEQKTDPIELIRRLIRIGKQADRL